MIRGVIFDLDGTLGNTLPVCYRAFGRVLSRRLGRPFGDREIHAMFGPSEEGILLRLCPDDAEAALDEYLGEYHLGHAICPLPFAGVPELLRLLRARGVELAIVTGKGPRSARISLEVFGLADCFPCVEAGSPAGGVKSAAMRRVLRRWGLPAAEVVGIGDSPTDIRSARQVGIRSAAAAWAPTADAETLASCKPDYLFRKVGALRRWLEDSTAALRR